MDNEYISFPNKYLELNVSECRDMGFDGQVYDTLYNMVDIYDPEFIYDDHILLDYFPEDTISNNVKFCIDELKERNIFKPNISYNLYVGEDTNGEEKYYMYKYDKDNEYFKEGRTW